MNSHNIMHDAIAASSQISQIRTQVHGPGLALL